MTDIEAVEGSKTEIATTQVKHTDSSGNTGTGSDDILGKRRGRRREVKKGIRI
jgi:hypothetical protein